MANWGNISSRGNVEDRRGAGGLVVGGLGVGGVVIALVFNLLTGGNLGDVLSTIDQVAPSQTQQSEEFAGEDSYEVFASQVLGSANDMWREYFASQNLSYREPKLVLFRQATQSACGVATSDIGPHYCSLDRTIYLDETFFQELQIRFGARGGDVAEAYVIAHEVGHHAQNELGIMRRTGNSNEDSIQVELQADCFAGLWGNSIKDLQVLTPGEIGEAMDAAAAVGDDRIQGKVLGQISPETWTHGSSQQRVAAFTKGFESGTVDACSDL